MAGARIGGDSSSVRYFGLFLFGVALGSAIRVVAFVVPTGIVRRLESRLLSGMK